MVSVKLLFVAFVIVTGVLLSGCLCCCRTPDLGTYSPPVVVPKEKPTIKPLVTQVPTVVPVVVSNVTQTPQPVIIVMVRPNTT